MTTLNKSLGKPPLIKLTEIIFRARDIMLTCFRRCLRESNSIDSSRRLLQHRWDAISNKLD